MPRRFESPTRTPFASPTASPNAISRFGFVLAGAAAATDPPPTGTTAAVPPSPAISTAAIAAALTATRYLIYTAGNFNDALYRTRANLPGTGEEAERLEAHFNTAEPGSVETLKDASLADLDEALKGKSTFFFLGHGDMVLQGEYVLAFVGADGKLESITADTLVSIFKKHAKHGHLKEVVLMGCCTKALGERLRSEAGVEVVICWDSKLHDKAAPIFSESYAKARAAMVAPKAAFDQAKLAVEAKTEDGYYDNGVQGKVAMYKFVAPEDRTAVYQKDECGRMPDGRFHLGRLKVFAQRALRGPFAAGLPILIESSSVESALTALSGLEEKAAKIASASVDKVTEDLLEKGKKEDALEGYRKAQPHLKDQDKKDECKRLIEICKASMHSGTVRNSNCPCCEKPLVVDHECFVPWNQADRNAKGFTYKPEGDKGPGYYQDVDRKITCDECNEPFLACLARSCKQKGCDYDVCHKCTPKKRKREATQGEPGSSKDPPPKAAKPMAKLRRHGTV